MKAIFSYLNSLPKDWHSFSLEVSEDDVMNDRPTT